MGRYNEVFKVRKYTVFKNWNPISTYAPRRRTWDDTTKFSRSESTHHFLKSWIGIHIGSSTIPCNAMDNQRQRFFHLNPGAVISCDDLRKSGRSKSRLQTLIERMLNIIDKSIVLIVS
jgi:hypothetical protein